MDNYLGEIKLFAGNFPPLGWAFCNGALLSIAEYDALYNLIGTTYGGDGIQTFGLPNLQGRIPIGWGSGPGLPTVVIGESAGTEEITLTTNQMPNHTHIAQVQAKGSLGVGTTATSNAPEGFAPADDSGSNMYANAAPNGAMGPDAVASTSPTVSVMPVGGSQPHDNMQPYLVISYIIALYGIYPSPS